MNTKTKGNKKSNKKRIVSILLAVVLLTVFVVWAAKGNTALEINSHVIKSERLPEVFSGYRIAQVSDLHNAALGKDNERLLSALEDTQADAIALTGDLVDSRRTDVDVALRFAEKAAKIAPTYYVTGNHEARISEYETLKSGLIACGVTVLENQAVTIEKAGESIRFIGLQDPAFTGERDNAIERAYIEAQLDGFARDETYTVLLSHRPELFEAYAEWGADLALSGHAHGGQFRLPYIGGLFAPDQGFFPKYDAGLYEKKQTKMLVSRGLGNSLFPFRVNNNPEIVVAVLKS